MEIPKPETVPGWMALDCLDWLAAQGAMSSSIIEIGCWKGRSTLALLSRSKAKLFAVDTWMGTLDDEEQNRYFLDKQYAYMDFRKNVKFYLKNEQIVPLQMTSVQAADMIRAVRGEKSIDLIFIDGDHRYTAVLQDIQLYLPLLKPGGLIAGHDYGTKRWPGVKRAVSKVFHRNVVEIGPGSIWSRRMP